MATINILKGLIGKEDLNIGSGTFNRLKSDGTSQTLTKIQMLVLPGVFVATESPYSAAGNGTTDDTAALQALFDAASAYGVANGGLAYCIIPPGTYSITEMVFVSANTYVKCLGTIQFDGDNDQGGMINVRSESNVVWDGGILDGNDGGNINGWSVTGMTHDPVTEGFRGDDEPFDGESRGVWFQNATVLSCKHFANIGQGVGAGGGKGFSIQFGARQCFVDNVRIEDCDIGFSVESKSNESGHNQAVNITNVSVKDALYTGCYLYGDSSDEPATGDWQGINIDNVFFEECASTTSADFGVITSVSAHGVVMRNARIRNSSGTVDIVRGCWRQSDIQVFADCYNVANIVNLTKDTGHNGSTQQSRNTSIKVKAKVRASASGYLLKHDGTSANTIAQSDVDIGFMYWDGTDLAGNAWPGTGLFLSGVLGNQCQWRVSNLTDGEVIQGDGASDPVFPNAESTLKNAFNRASIQYDSANTIVALRASQSTDTIGIRNASGSTVMRAVANGSKMGKQHIHTNNATFTADDTTPDVSEGNVFTTPANTGATAITTFDNASNGQVLYIICGSSTNSPTIADSGNFKLSAAWAPNVDDTITLVYDGTSFIELARSAN